MKSSGDVDEYVLTGGRSVSCIIFIEFSHVRTFARSSVSQDDREMKTWCQRKIEIKKKVSRWFRRTGVARPLSSMPGRSNKRKPPRGLVVNHDDLAALAGQPSQANNSLQAIDTEIVSLKRQVRY